MACRAFKVVKKLSYNTYVIDLPSNYGINHIFNIIYLTQFPTMTEQASATMEPPMEWEAAIRVPKNTTLKMKLLLYLIISLLIHIEGIITNFYSNGEIVQSLIQFDYRP